MHQCVRCSTFFDDDSQELLKGCSKCGGKFFFFVKKESIGKAQDLTKDLTREDREQMEQDVKEIIGIEDENQPIILDLENIKVLKPGKFELDLIDLFKKRPLIYKLEEGKYYIDVASVLESKDLGLKEKEKLQKEIEEDTDK